MATERTLSIIKPDATKRNLTGKINAKFEDAGLRIIAQKRIHLTKEQAGVFTQYMPSVRFMTNSANLWPLSRSLFRFSKVKARLPRTVK